MKSEVQNYIKLPLRNLEKGKHVFTYSVDSGLFSDFQNSEIINGSAEISLKVEKFRYFMDVVLSFSGILTVSCDRCLENLDVPVESENILSVRFEEEPGGAKYESPDEDVIYIHANEEEIDLTVYVYESICLALPIQRMHGDDENGKSLCNPEMLKYIMNRN